MTSLHYHFPWMVKAYLKWSIYVTTTKRKMRKAFDWDPFYEIAKLPLPYPEKLARYGDLARQKLEAPQFEEFSATHLKNVDEVAWEFFGTAACKEAVRKKVAALFPAHEVEQFTELFFKRIQAWRADQSESAEARSISEGRTMSQDMKQTGKWHSSRLQRVVKAGRRLTAIEVKSGRAPLAHAGTAAFAQAFKAHRTLLVGGDGAPVEEFLSQPVARWVGP